MRVREQEPNGGRNRVFGICFNLNCDQVSTMLCRMQQGKLSFQQIKWRKSEEKKKSEEKSIHRLPALFLSPAFGLFIALKRGNGKKKLRRNFFDRLHSVNGKRKLHPTPSSVPTSRPFDVTWGLGRLRYPHRVDHVTDNVHYIYDKVF